jgi:hypothetical protein
MGINFDAADNFKLILGSGGKDITIPMKYSEDGPVVNYLSFDLRPENGVDVFTLEARYGKARVSGDAKVPYLAPHDHPADGTAKPPDKKP